MNQLFKTIALEAYFQNQRLLYSATVAPREEFFHNMSAQLAADLGSEFHPTSDLVAEACAMNMQQKVRAHANISRGLCKGHLVIYTGSKTIKKTYRRAHAARAEANRLNAANERYSTDADKRPFAAIDEASYYLSLRAVAKTNFMSRTVFLEMEGTPYYCSPSSETYWSN